MTTRALQFLVGVSLLFLGRKLYWLFVAGVGFVVAMDLVPRFAQVESTLLILIIALAAGLVGALLAVFLQKLGIAVAGFFAAGYAVLALLDFAGLEANVLAWVLALVGGILGAVLTLVLFDWALIILSSLIGAWMITQGLGLTNSLLAGLAFLLLLVIGVAIQASLSTRAEAPTD
jgi:hypothetical protein